MELADSQVTGILKLVLVQQQDILHTNAHVLALERAIVEHLGGKPSPQSRADHHQEGLPLQSSTLPIENGL